MLKMVKVWAGAIVLAAFALPVIAQQLTVTREAEPQAAPATPKKADLRPKYFVVRGKVLMRTDKNGVTRYGYENGRMVREIRQNGVAGTYQYDSGKFTGVVYTDGRYITASYAPNGALLGLTSDTSAQVKFRVKNKPTRAGSFVAIQNGIAALRNPGAANYCIGTDDDATCTIIVEDSPRPEDWGGGGFGSGVDISLPDEAPMPSGEGDGGNFRPGDDLPPDRCKAEICDVALVRGAQICKVETTNIVSFGKCMTHNLGFFNRCYRSCDDGDWSWLNWWDPRWN